MTCIKKRCTYLPIELVDIIKYYVIYQPQTKEELKKVVKQWVTNKEVTKKKYGHISLWDTSKINDMSYLFENYNVIYCFNTEILVNRYFNENINNWDVSNVINMEGMFKNCTYFNQPLNFWNTSKVINMDSMFSSNDTI